MKQLLTLITLFFFAANATNAANERESVKLDDDNPQWHKKIAKCNFFVKKGDIDDDGNTKVTIEIENLDENNVVILFERAYTEKCLNEQHIAFDKTFPGDKGQREIDTYKGIPEKIYINPTEKRTLPEIQAKGGEVQLCRFPLYFANYKGKSRKKLLLLEQQIIELKIEVEVKPDENFSRLDKESNDLIDEISKQTFCNNPKHKVSLEKQKAPYEDKIAKIKNDIDSIVKKEYFKKDRMAKEYENIKQKLDSIDFSRRYGDCGNHKPTPIRRHSCKYCNLSLQAIYHKLDDYYKKLHNRKTTKSAVIEDVKILYRCCTDVNCTRHTSSWRNSEYKAKITDYYNRICNF